MFDMEVFNSKIYSIIYSRRSITAFLFCSCLPIYNCIKIHQQTPGKYKINMSTIKILQGGRGGDTFEASSPYEQFLPLSSFRRDSLMTPTPTPHFKNLSLLPPHPIHHPLMILMKNLIIHHEIICFNVLYGLEIGIRTFPLIKANT